MNCAWCGDNLGKPVSHGICWYHKYLCFDKKRIAQKRLNIKNRLK